MPRHHSIRNSRAIQTAFENLESRRLLSHSSPIALAGSGLPLGIEAQQQPVGGTVNLNNDDGLTIAYIPATHVLQNPWGFLTPASSADALTVARGYLSANADQLGLEQSDIDNAIVTNRYTDSGSGVTHIYLRQTLAGLPIVGAEMGVHLMPDGRIISANSSFVGGLSGKSVATPAIKVSSTQALRLAASALDLPETGPLLAMRARNQLTINASSISLDPIPVATKYFITADGPKLGWDFVVRPPDHNGDWYDIAVSTQDGSVLFASNWTDHVAQFNVYPIPTEAPNDGSRQLVADPSDPLASPFGWNDTDGVSGADSTLTKGNNVSAQEDTDANNSGGFSPDGGASLNFDFPLNLAQSPSNYQSAAITNLYYWNNVLHDVHYHYGFTEAAGNFQQNNYGRGGAGGDRVQADAQDGAGTNNANFGTPPDGLSGRMQMFVWSTTSPSRDGDLDSTIMIHEYGHGVSNRLTGGPANASALDALQSGGMGEGWSDFWALMLTLKPTDAFLTGRFGMATYVLGQSSSGTGLRRFPYSYDMSLSPLTIDAYGTSGTSSGVSRSTEVHDTGEIWAATLWDMAALLINKYGFDADVYTGYTTTPGPGHAGNKLALQLVADALKLQPANPSFSQARDAILQADLALTGGQNRAEIWQAFARRGMGVGFNDGGSSASTGVSASFAVPPANPVVVAQSLTPGRPLVQGLSSFSVSFSEPISPASLSLADFSLTGPGGVDLSATIAGFSTSASNSTLTLTFAPTNAVGTYTLSIGPDILAADDAGAMDQNLNNTPGEAGDAYVTTFTVVSRIADGTFGYEAGPWAFQNVLLTQGGPGVVSILSSADDSNAIIPLGSNTFQFYASTYSSSVSNAISVCDNGFVSFGVVSTAYSNTDMSSPSAPRFAALWDDWYTQVDSSDMVLYRFDDLNGDSIQDRLVIQWNNVHSTSGGSGVTFQAILQLNTGGVPGVMIANYINIQSDNAGVSNGASASVGIKDNGTPPSNKLLVTMNDGSFPWLGDGTAIRIATDWTAPTISTSAFTYETAPQKITYQFSENVAASLKAASLNLVNTTTGLPVPTANVAMSYNAGTNTATFTFPGYANGILPDGNYTASLSNVTDAAWNPLAGASTVEFFVLAGDANHDRVVDISDLAILATNWQQTSRTFSQGNFTYADDVVDISDLAILATNWQKSLPAPAGIFATRLSPRISHNRVADQVFAA